MLESITKLYGHSLAGSDGDIGHVKDFYFDDQSWAVRYFVADTGTTRGTTSISAAPNR